MEKRTPHYLLQEIQAIIAVRGLSAFTATAAFNAAGMGLSDEQAVAVVMTISRAMFHKSLTTQIDHRNWQDVYHAPCPNGKTAYIKFALRDGAVVIQFKEK